MNSSVGRVACLVVGLWVLWSGASAQKLQPVSVSAWAAYDHGFGLKKGQGLRQVNGWATGCAASFRLTRAVGLGIRAGYFDLQIEQDRAVEQWGWAFWQRFYGNYVRDLQSRDKSYRATFTPDQHLYMTELMPLVTLRWPDKGKAALHLAVGAGALFYERTLRLHEVWEKHFPELNYVFVYDYYNHAEVRKGVVYAARFEVGCELMVQRYVCLRVSAACGRIVPAGGRSYERFPMTTLGELVGALVFLY
ncbi:MAG: hypothetical protein ONB14_09735 [candidate division KSB1 bacterium]|nr:hypothetical protein [candidate division KSB1 bacterium]MDZ7384850.1 hypothetical protein [candidate division KSB1 bacterium]MDZ7411948.1 hypothetical protein [candidate division KSB1 bacterium]